MPAAQTSNPGPSFQITVTDSNSSQVGGPFTLTVALGTLSITTPTTLPSTLLGTGYTTTIVVQGGIQPYSFALTSGSLPGGLSLSGSGVISGTATASGTASFTVTVYDNNFHFTAASFTLTVGGSAVSISTPAILPSGSVGAAYSTSLAATGGVSPYTWSITSGSLPPGLVISSAGVISGTPTTTGTYIFSAQVEDNTLLTASQPFSLTIAAAGLSPRTGVISQFVSGGGWVTTIWLVNRTAVPVQTTLTIHADNGGTQTVPVTVTQGTNVQEIDASTLNEAIQPNTTLVITTLPQAQSSQNVEGWVDVMGNGALSGFAFYSNGTEEASVPLQTTIGNSFTLPFDNTNGNSMGVAIVNLASVQNALTATVWDQNGNHIASVPVALTLADTDGLGHDSFQLPARIAATAGIKGIIQFVGNAATTLAPAGQVTGLGLLVAPNNLFTSMQTIVP